MSTFAQNTKKDRLHLKALLGSFFLHGLFLSILLYSGYRVSTVTPEDSNNFTFINVSIFDMESKAPGPSEKSNDLQVSAPSNSERTESLESVSESYREQPETIVKSAKPLPDKKQIKKNLDISTKKAQKINDSEDFKNVSKSLESTTTSEGNSDITAASRISSTIAASYQQIVLSKLQEAKRYPPRALSRGIEGNVVLKLEISGNGEVIGSDIKSSSGYSFFDEEVLEMVKRASPFPSTNSDVRFSYIVPIAFRLEN